MRRFWTVPLLAAAALAACGDDEKQGEERTSGPFAPVKSYLVDHSGRLAAGTGQIERNARAYHALAKSEGFDYERLLRERRADVRHLVRQGQEAYRRANPSYEEMEGIVAGVPELADYDVDIDAGGDASDPENAVSFSIETPRGRTFEQPGNYFFLIETALYGTEPRFAAKGVRPDLDGDGRVEFGEAMPDADFYLAAARDFARTARELDADARAYTPTRADVFNALVVMTPTMSEYFESWKNSRFVSGSRASEKAFVATSRLSDIADIFGGLVVIYRSATPLVRKANPDQAAQTGRALRGLRDLAARLERREAGGERFTPEQADTLGSEAQSRAEAVAGQISQAAGRLGIKLQN